MNSKILMISTGGTLASSHGGNGLSPRLGGSEILKKISGLTAGFEVEEEELFSLDSSNVQPEEWTQLARRIYIRRKAYDGIVVIHGTDTLAYTASALSFALPGIEIPVVLTGSQVRLRTLLQMRRKTAGRRCIWRPADAPGSMWPLTAKS